MRVIPSRDSSPQKPSAGMIMTLSPEFSSYGLNIAGQAAASAAWVSANDPIAVPFRLPFGCVVTALGWFNGSAAGEGVDVGIYTEAFTRLVSTGAQTGAGNLVWQFIDVADTALAPGRYYLVQSRDNVTANRNVVVGALASVALLAATGCFDSATNAYPLPDPLTNMATAATFTRVPVMGMQTRVVF